jgi:Domain of Unknown Function (DUF1206)
MTLKRATDEAGATARRAASQPWVEPVARLGFMMRGVLYLIIGVLAVQLAAGKEGGAKSDQVGAIATIAAQPIGKFLLILVAIGPAGYAIAGLVWAILDPQHEGQGAKGVAMRVGHALGAMGYGLLVIPTVGFITGSVSQSSGDASAQEWTARLMSAPLGPWLVGIAGAISLVGALVQFYTAYTAGFKDELMLGRMGYDQRRWAMMAGRAGYAARGVVFGLVGFFLIVAALQQDSKQAHGLDGAMHSLIQQPYGTWLLGIVALGLVAFGVYSILTARLIKMR